MRSVFIQLDEVTLRALNRVAPARKRQRSEFIREAIRKAVREAEYAGMRAAYRRQPDSSVEADNWSNPEEFKH